MVHEFSEKEIVKRSGYISAQCCGSTEIELGTVCATEMGIYEISEANTVATDGVYCRDGDYIVFRN